MSSSNGSDIQASGRVSSPLDVLRGAQLACVHKVMEDGHPSVIVRSNDDAAQAALDALAAAGYSLWREATRKEMHDDGF